jgi:farnesol dehydrogenase
MNRPTLVTGATGFIGTYVVRRLVASGESVRVLVRAPERIEPGLRNRVEIMQGDIRDAGALSAAVRGAGRVLHLAALARADARDRTEFQTINVDAVRTLLDLARRENVESLVHVSTVLTLAPFAPARVNGAATARTLYESTKLAGEQLVEQYVSEGRYATIVHPTRVFGPGPLTDANAISRVIAGYLAGWFRVRLDDEGALSNYVHVDDVAAGIIRAAERGAAGAHYALGGENASFPEFLRLIDEVAGVHHRVFALSPALALAVASVAELWSHAGGVAPISRPWIRAFLEDRRVDIEPAKRDLGYEPRTLRAGIDETVSWIRSGAR